MVVGECRLCSVVLGQTDEGELGGNGAVICRDGKLRGTYGSDHDLSTFEILDGEIAEGAMFCDACINEMIAQGKLREIGTADLA